MSYAKKIDVLGVFIDKSNTYSSGRPVRKKTVGRITTADGINNMFPKFTTAMSYVQKYYF